MQLLVLLQIHNKPSGFSTNTLYPSEINFKECFECKLEGVAIMTRSASTPSIDGLVSSAKMDASLASFEISTAIMCSTNPCL